MNTNPIEITTSKHFLEWLHTEKISLTFSTYQTNRLFMLGVKPDGDLSTYERLFDRPMGLCAQQDRLYVGGRYQIWRFDNALPPGETYKGQFDALYVPRQSHTTGDVDIHDLHLGKNGRLLFANTLYSCVATTSDRYSFRPLWTPPFISKIAPEDRCHLNGLAIKDGQPAYVTAVSASDTFSGWRKRRKSGGRLIDVQNNHTLLNNLSMPHSPRWHNGRLYLLNAGTGDLMQVNLETQKAEPLAFCPGFARGLTFHNQYAIVGLSKPRHANAFRGLELDRRLAKKDSDALCGLAIIDTHTGNTVHWVEIEGAVSELFDVAVLPNVTCPALLGFKGDEISRFVTIDFPNKRPLFQQLKENPKNKTPSIDFMALQLEQTRPVQPAPSTTRPTTTASSPYRYQISTDMTPEAAVQQFGHLTFPPIAQTIRGRQINHPLVAAVARHTPTQEIIAMILAEPQADNAGYTILSGFVDGAHRQQKVATRLIQTLEKQLAQQGVAYLDFSYSTDWNTYPFIEKMLVQQKWEPPQTTLHQFRVPMANLTAAPWRHAYQTLPSEYTFFPWTELTPEERTHLLQQAAHHLFPANMNPFQAEVHRAWNSMGLRHNGRVVGWMITHHTAADTIQYTSLYLDPQYQNRQIGVALLSASVSKQLDESDTPIGICQVEPANKPMLAFTRHYFQEYAARQSEQRHSRHMLL